MPIVFRVGFVDLHGATLHLVAGHFGNFADFNPVVVENRDVQHILEIVFFVVADIGFCALGRQDAITLLPNPQRVGFDSRNIFNVLDKILVAEMLFAFPL